MISTIKYLLCIHLLFISHLEAQNLVRNPSFEKYERIPCKLGVGVEQGKMKQYIHHWTIPVYGSPDVYHQEGLKICPETYQRYKSVIEAKHGKITLGIYSIKNHTNELIQTKLKRPLLPAKIYQVSLWVRQREKGHFSNNIGVYFSDKAINITNPLKAFSQKPDVSSDTIIRTYNWVQILDTVIVDSPKTHIIIGGFRPKETQLYDISNSTIVSSTVSAYY